jgi:hypothetical protein
MKRTAKTWPAPSRVKADGRCVARCPACSENGQDTKGAHLWWDPATGAFACVANPGVDKHRQRIVELVGTPPDGRETGSKAEECRPLRLGQPAWGGFNLPENL